MTNYEYGMTNDTGTVQSGGMTEREVLARLADLTDSDPEIASNFRIIRRSLGEWESV